MNTSTQFFISLFISLGVGQCQRTIKWYQYFSSQGELYQKKRMNMQNISYLSNVFSDTSVYPVHSEASQQHQTLKVVQSILVFQWERCWFGSVMFKPLKLYHRTNFILGYISCRCKDCKLPVSILNAFYLNFLGVVVPSELFPLHFNYLFPHFLVLFDIIEQRTKVLCRDFRQPHAIFPTSIREPAKWFLPLGLFQSHISLKSNTPCKSCTRRYSAFKLLFNVIVIEHEMLRSWEINMITKSEQYSFVWYFTCQQHSVTTNAKLFT